MSSGNHSEEFAFTVDLCSDEVRRRAEFLSAVGPDWDPVTALREQEQAYDLLYSDLDQHQRETYERLVRAGVLPERGGGRDTA